MSGHELWSELQKFAPGSYKNALQTTIFNSRAETLQVQSILKNIIPLPIEPEVGVVWFPIVHDKTIPIGVLGQVRAILDIHNIFPSAQYSQDGKKLKKIPILEQWFFYEFGYMPQYVLHFVQEHIPSHWEVEGDSWFFAALVAMISRFLERPPRFTPICSGTLGFNSSSQIKAYYQSPIFQGICDIDVKNQLIEWEFPNIDPCLLDKDSNIDQIQIKAQNYLNLLFGVSWKEEMYLTLKMEPRTLAEQGYEFYKIGKKSLAKRIGLSLQKQNSGDLVAKSYANFIIGASTKHFRMDEELDPHELLLTSLDAYQNHQESSDFDIHYVYQIVANLGMSYLLNFQFTSGIVLLETFFQQLQEFPKTFQDRQWKESTLRVCGSLRWLYIVSGDLDKAEKVMNNWNLGRVYVQSAMCRAYYELSDLYRRKNQLSQAKEALQISRANFTKILPNQRPVTARFLMLHEIRLELQSAQYVTYSQHPQSLIEWLEGFEYSLQQGNLTFWRYVTSHINQNTDRKKIAYIASGFLARFWMKISEDQQLDGAQKKMMQNWILEQIHDLRNQLADLPQKPSQALQEFSLGFPEKWLMYAPY